MGNANGFDLDERAWCGEMRADALTGMRRDSLRGEADEIDRESRSVEIYERKDGSLYAAVFCDSEPDLPEAIYNITPGSGEAYDILRQCKNNTMESPRRYLDGYAGLKHECEQNRGPYRKLWSSSVMIADGGPGYDNVYRDIMKEDGLAEFGYADLCFEGRLFRIEKPSVACTGPDGEPFSADEIPEVWDEEREGCTLHIKAPALCMDEEPVGGVQTLYELRCDIHSDSIEGLPFTADSAVDLAIDVLDPTSGRPIRNDEKAVLEATGLAYDWNKSVGSRIVSAPEREEAL